MQIPLSLCYSDSFAASEAKKKREKKNTSLRLYKLGESLWVDFVKTLVIKEVIVFKALPKD